MAFSPVAPAYPSPRLLERSLDLLFPPLCVGCRRVGRWICPDCWPRVGWLAGSICGVCNVPSGQNPCRQCSDPTSPVRTVVAVAGFGGLAREAVHALKYEGRHAISSMMGRLMAEAAAPVAADLLVPIPLHTSRRRERGYDQAALLTRAAARELQLPASLDTLRRVRKTRQQVRLTLEERRLNVEGAFVVTRTLDGETVLLLDDVFTTGSTMRSAAEELRKAGAGSVVALVFGLATIGDDRPLS
jgi:ComF family protein